MRIQSRGLDKSLISSDTDALTSGDIVRVISPNLPGIKLTTSGDSTFFAMKGGRTVTGEIVDYLLIGDEDDDLPERYIRYVELTLPNGHNVFVSDFTYNDNAHNELALQALENEVRENLT